MKKSLLFIISIISFNCSSSSNGDTPTPVVPIDGASVAWGAVSVDFNLQEDKATNAYYVISDKELSLTADEIKTQAQAPSNSSIKFNGTITLKANEGKTTTITKLLENTKYYSYLVKESNSSLGEIQKQPFQTYYRQDTSKTNTYHSTAENREVRYIIYRPEEVLKYGAKKQYPILFFLGGNGEVATNSKPMNYYNYNRTLPEYIKNGGDVPMMVFTIQHTVQNWNAKLIDEGVDFAISKFNVDTKKVYMSGCSGGGYGCWNYSVEHPEKLAAIVPISGGGSTGKACKLKDVAIWAFHNSNDYTVSSVNSKNMIDAVKACSPTKEVSLTFFEDNDGKNHHDCWRRVFNKDDKDWSKTPNMAKVDIYTWLLSKSK